MSYKEKKESVRWLAIAWSNNCNGNESLEEMATASDMFEKLGRKYGLIREFRENGVI